MKKTLFAITILAITASSALANNITTYDAEGNIISPTNFNKVKTQPQQPKASQGDKSITVQYVKHSEYGNSLLVGFSATHKGWVTCKAYDESDNVVDIVTHFNDAADREFIMDGKKAVKASCRYK